MQPAAVSLGGGVQLGRAWDLLFAITSRELVLRYRGTVLGYVWWVLRPLALGVLLWFALGKVLALDIPNYHVFIMAGLFPWFWFSSAVSETAGVLLGYSNLVKRVQFPRIILPLSASLGNAAQFVLTLPVLIIFVLIAGEGAHPMWIVGIPLLFVMQFALTVGVGAAAAALSVFVRDLSPLIDVGLSMLFYASAIIYPLDRVPDDVRPILRLNPVTSLMEGWRSVLLDGSLPGHDIWPAATLSVAALVIGLAIFRSLEKHVADAL